MAAIARHFSQPVKPGSPVCTGCGDDIPDERRAAVPGASTCITCARRAEERGKAWKF
ncbi:TraR/DksA C4-type zinc finger protein [Hartmannibacter diazotrophicus]|uniref:TraR/DksA C4-type zinc finger protein n=1 Tax=Hartmannibacter diazotrophicus TaxID=1482074 RepID=UPI0018D51EE4